MIINWIKKNKVFLLLVIVITLSMLFSYKLLKVKPPIEDKDLYIKSSVELKSDELDENKKISIDGKEKKRLKLVFKNNFNKDKKIYVWYKVDNDKVSVGNLSTSSIKLSKDGLVIEKNRTIEVEIGIKNDSEEVSVVEFGIIYKDIGDVLDINNYKFIDQVFKLNNNRMYSIGDRVILKNNSYYHVIKESDNNDIYVTLLSDDIIKINNNNSLDVKDNKVLFNVNDENISFYLDNNYRKELEDKEIKIGEDGEIRLITLGELQNISEFSYKDYNYYGKNVPSWLNIKKPWWTMTPYSSDGHYYVVGKNILSTKDVKKTRAGLRIVLKLLKSNIK